MDRQYVKVVRFDRDEYSYYEVSVVTIREHGHGGNITLEESSPMRLTEEQDDMFVNGELTAFDDDYSYIRLITRQDETYGETYEFIYFDNDNFEKKVYHNYLTKCQDRGRIEYYRLSDRETKKTKVELAADISFLHKNKKLRRKFTKAVLRLLYSKTRFLEIFNDSWAGKMSFYFKRFDANKDFYGNGGIIYEEWTDNHGRNQRDYCIHT